MNNSLLRVTSMKILLVLLSAVFCSDEVFKKCSYKTKNTGEPQELARYLPYNQNKGNYYICSNGIPLLFTCGPTKVFDSSTFKCIKYESNLVESADAECKAKIECHQMTNKEYRTHPMDCQKYFKCKKRKPKIKTCKKNRYFDEERQKCVKNKNFNTKNSTCLCLNKDQSILDSKKCDPNVICLESYEFQRHPADCRKYYKCKKDRPKVYTCSEGLYFSVNDQKCINRHLSNCTDRCEEQLYFATSTTQLDNDSVEDGRDTQGKYIEIDLEEVVNQEKYSSPHEEVANSGLQIEATKASMSIIIEEVKKQAEDLTSNHHFTMHTVKLEDQGGPYDKVIDSGLPFEATEATVSTIIQGLQNQAQDLTTNHDSVMHKVKPEKHGSPYENVINSGRPFEATQATGSTIIQGLQHQAQDLTTSHDSMMHTVKPEKHGSPYDNIFYSGRPYQATQATVQTIIQGMHHQPHDLTTNHDSVIHKVKPEKHGSTYENVINSGRPYQATQATGSTIIQGLQHQAQYLTTNHDSMMHTVKPEKHGSPYENVINSGRPFEATQATVSTIIQGLQHQAQDLTTHHDSMMHILKPKKHGSTYENAINSGRPYQATQPTGSTIIKGLQHQTQDLTTDHDFMMHTVKPEKHGSPYENVINSGRPFEATQATVSTIIQGLQHQAQDLTTHHDSMMHILKPKKHGSTYENAINSGRPYQATQPTGSTIIKGLQHQTQDLTTDHDFMMHTVKPEKHGSPYENVINSGRPFEATQATVSTIIQGLQHQAQDLTTNHDFVMHKVKPEKHGSPYENVINSGRPFEATQATVSTIIQELQHQAQDLTTNHDSMKHTVKLETHGSTYEGVINSGRPFEATEATVSFIIQGIQHQAQDLTTNYESMLHTVKPEKHGSTYEDVINSGRPFEATQATGSTIIQGLQHQAQDLITNHDSMMHTVKPEKHGSPYDNIFYSGRPYQTTQATVQTIIQGMHHQPHDLTTNHDSVIHKVKPEKHGSTYENVINSGRPYQATQATGSTIIQGLQHQAQDLTTNHDSMMHTAKPEKHGSPYENVINSGRPFEATQATVSTIIQGLQHQAQDLTTHHDSIMHILKPEKHGSTYENAINSGRPYQATQATGSTIIQGLQHQAQDLTTNHDFVMHKVKPEKHGSPYENVLNSGRPFEATQATVSTIIQELQHQAQDLTTNHDSMKHTVKLETHGSTYEGVINSGRPFEATEATVSSIIQGIQYQAQDLITNHGSIMHTVKPEKQGSTYENVINSGLPFETTQATVATLFKEVQHQAEDLTSNHHSTMHTVKPEDPGGPYDKVLDSGLPFEATETTVSTIIQGLQHQAQDLTTNHYSMMHTVKPEKHGSTYENLMNSGWPFKATQATVPTIIHGMHHKVQDLTTIHNSMMHTVKSEKHGSMYENVINNGRPFEATVATVTTIIQGVQHQAQDLTTNDDSTVATVKPEKQGSSFNEVTNTELPFEATEATVSTIIQRVQHQAQDLTTNHDSMTHTVKPEKHGSTYENVMNTGLPFEASQATVSTIIHGMHHQVQDLTTNRNSIMHTVKPEKYGSTYGNVINTGLLFEATEASMATTMQEVQHQANVVTSNHNSTMTPVKPEKQGSLLEEVITTVLPFEATQVNKSTVMQEVQNQAEDLTSSHDSTGHTEHSVKAEKQREKQESVFEEIINTVLPFEATQATVSTTMQEMQHQDENLSSNHHSIMHAVKPEKDGTPYEQETNSKLPFEATQTTSPTTIEEVKHQAGDLASNYVSSMHTVKPEKGGRPYKQFTNSEEPFKATEATVSTIIQEVKHQAEDLTTNHDSTMHTVTPEKYESPYEEIINSGLTFEVTEATVLTTLQEVKHQVSEDLSLKLAGDILSNRDSLHTVKPEKEENPNEEEINRPFEVTQAPVSTTTQEMKHQAEDLSSNLDSTPHAVKLENEGHTYEDVIDSGISSSTTGYGTYSHLETPVDDESSKSSVEEHWTSYLSEEPVNTVSDPATTESMLYAL